MTKFFALVAAALVAIGTQAQASTLIDIGACQAQTMASAELAAGLNWHVGDQADYKLSIGGFINGTSHNFVREDAGTSFWMEQDMDLGFMGKQKIEILINKTTGKVEKMLANGQEQQVPDAGDQEIVEMHEDNVTVAAGSFPCIYAKIKSKKDNSIQEAWINPQLVPMTGMLKALADSQFGKVTQEATKFSFQK
jgi:hypothetical protein